MPGNSYGARKYRVAAACAGIDLLHLNHAAQYRLRPPPKGAEAFVAQYGIRGGKEVLETIGTMAIIPSVAEARNRARASMQLAR